MDQLFLLRPGFHDALGGPWFCPWCARLEGLLAYSPHLSAQLDICRVPFERPRAAVVALLGEAQQACPVLVLDPANQWHEARKALNGRLFLVADEMLPYLAERYGVPRPHP